MTSLGSPVQTAEQGDLFVSRDEDLVPRLLPHQELEVAFLRRQRFALLASETGCGKTATYLHRVADVLGSGGKVVITVPAALISQTLDAIAKLQPDLPAPYVVGQTKGPLRVGQPFFLVTHELLRTRPPVLSNLRPELVVVDEADKAATADPQGKTKSAVQDLTGRAGRIILVTATPENGATGLGIAGIADIGQFPGRPHRNELLRHILHRTVTTGNFRQEKPYEIQASGIELLRPLLETHSIRTTVDQIGAHMPEIRRIEIEVPLHPDEVSAYLQAAQAAGLAGHQQEVKLSRSVQSLIPAAVRYLCEGDGSKHEKTVAFTETLDLLEPLAAALKALGITVLVITSKVSAKQRAEMVRQHHLPGRSILLGTSAIEKGLNLQNSSQILTLQQTWSPSRQYQLEGRARRIGSDHDVITHAIIRPDVPLEYRRAQALDRKEAIIEKFVAMIPTTETMKGA